MLIELGIQGLHKIEAQYFFTRINFFPFFSLFLLSLIFLSLLVVCFSLFLLSLIFLSLLVVVVVGGTPGTRVGVVGFPE